MRLPLSNLPAGRTHRRFIAVLMMFAYLSSSVGAPLQLTSARRDSRPFPCQGHRCACQSADSCWGHCCCFTLSERLAWAKAHDIDPPADEVTGHDDDHDRPSSPCCHKQDDDPDHTVTACDHKPDPSSSHGVRALKCHGLSTLWVASGAVVPVELQSSWGFDWIVVGHVSATNYDLLTVVLDPAVPPPRA